jgi:hypothetical protein
MVIAALLFFFWAVVPGLITGWMLRERGRSFMPGLLIGAVCGPLGILGVLTFIYFADRRRARAHANVRGRAVRVFYEVPVVGRLHVSTVWALAGVATFLCLWMIGGITYESYRAEQNPDSTPEQARPSTVEVAQASALLPTGTPTEKQTSDSKLTEQAQANTSAQARSALLGNFSGQPGQPAAAGAPPSNSATSFQPVGGTSGVPVAPPAQPAPGASGPSVMPQTNAPPPSAPTQPAAQTRADTVADVTRELASRGHRVHAALSGDSQTATLSVAGATLTREAGNQLLSRMRGSLKAVGVRVVVVMNGEQSWTYIL